MTMKVMNGLDLQSRPIVGLADPANPQEAATKNYVDSVIRGLDWKQEVVAASTGNVNIASPGTSLDGVTLVAQDRILLKDQTTASQNGIYVWTASAAALTRALDATTGVQLSGATTTVQRGTVNADRIYRCTADDPITVGTTNLPWVQVGAGGGGEIVTAGAGLTKSGTTLDVGQGTGIIVGADDVSVDFSTVARKPYAAAIGNGSLTSIPVTHGLGTRDVRVTVYDATTYEEVVVDNFRTDVNTVTLSFATAPTTGQYRVVIG